MRKLSISQIKTAVKETAIRLDKPLFVRGQFGIGKSQGIEQAVEELDSPQALQALLGRSCVYTGTMLSGFRLSQYEGVDMRGFPGIDKKTATSIWYPPSTLPFIGNDLFPDDKLIILFFDEAPDAKPDVFAVMQQLVLDRAVGEHLLKPNVRIVLAGNRDIDQALAKKFPMPLNNRLVHCEAVNPVEEFCVYAQGVGVPSVFIGFWNFRQELVNTYDPKKTTPIVATNRTWFTAVDIWRDKRLDSYPEIKEAMMIGSVGEGPVMEFMAYVDVHGKVPSIDRIKANPSGLPVPEELSLKYATAMHVSENMRLDNVDKLHIYLCRFSAEFVVMAWQLATARDATLFDSDSYMDFVKRFRDVYKNN